MTISCATEDYQGFEPKIFDSSADWYSSLYNEEGIAKPEMDYVTMFSELMENYDPKEMVSVEETRAAVLKNFLHYLREDEIDPAQIEEVLFPEDLLRLSSEFKKVRSYKIDLEYLIKKINDDEKVIENWDALRKCGLSITRLLKIYCESQIDEDGFPRCVEFLINEKHVPATTAFVFIKDKMAKEDDDDILESLRILSKNGLSTSIIRDYTPVAVSAYGALSDKESWGDFIDPDIFMDEFLDNYIRCENDSGYDTLMRFTDNLKLLSNKQLKKLYTSYTFLDDLWDKQVYEDSLLEVVEAALGYAYIDEIMAGVEADNEKSIIDRDPKLAAALYAYGANLDTERLKTAINAEKDSEYGECFAWVACREGMDYDVVSAKLWNGVVFSDTAEKLINYALDLYGRRGLEENNEKYEEAMDVADDYVFVQWFMIGCRDYYGSILKED